MVAPDGQDLLPKYADPNSDIEGGSESMQVALDVDECSINSSARPCLEAEKKDREELLRIGVQTAVVSV
ncbi:MAG: hypothetical protein BJ554DRAFT_6176 [Olpidium bornovanus]|uniref:Uncharacterized protein n=1 Tax=Olpidium bornovanus TaxID=278681 RepID=A0A8H7ZXY9_9FUNG|nr:MAG: hypothetical protein BJ554DRAFT_6176 [Olpidium bornovanus]